MIRLAIIGSAGVGSPRPLSPRVPIGSRPKLPHPNPLAWGRSSPPIPSTAAVAIPEGRNFLIRCGAKGFCRRFNFRRQRNVARKVEWFLHGTFDVIRPRNRIRNIILDLFPLPPCPNFGTWVKHDSLRSSLYGAGLSGPVIHSSLKGGRSGELAYQPFHR